MIRLEGSFARLLVLLGFCLVTGGVLIMLGLALAGPLFGISVNDVAQLSSQIDDPASLTVLKFLQLLNTLGLFILPGILFALLFTEKPLDYIKLKRHSSLENTIWVALLMFSILPATNWLVDWNASIELPESFRSVEVWMKNAEESAMALTKAFLHMDSLNDLITNLFLMALLPALGEELIFRGLVQQTINEKLRSYHVGIWVSAFLFSALHLQFYGFFPRMILGAFFGYLLQWSGNLWLPILAHFLNNAMAVIMAYYLGVQGMEDSFDQIGVEGSSWVFSLIGVLIFSTLLFNFYKRNKANHLE